ncbi:MAG: hypothetical protein RCH30_4380 [Candidatus Phytoplasma australasiaticum]|nr:hypothetical protein EPWB_v2c1480 ['Echinacea purpurea' witches'-broom phytoplasma]WEX20167.1 MAG: hypothetical protein TB2022_0540 [Candidatus Phytoplasma aurantifolia]WKV63924.1 MAG: hypothetical protein NCHU2022_c0440 [Candidatus Phytoplasma australasiaticum]QLL36834.1 hypothetical protein EPWB_v2c2250 ['Echinacea purpurea' witches'-broom phytoplasma]QLL36944.1 hypothetical protein EPWB_v2c3520 ['Echinacea purpurea' witches'-broom phytoplasma]
MNAPIGNNCKLHLTLLVELCRNFDLPKSTTKGLKLTAVRLKGKAKLTVVVSLILELEYFRRT